MLAAGRFQIIAGLVLILIFLAGRALAFVLAPACLLRRFLVIPVGLALIDVVLNLMQDLLVGLNAVLMIIHIIFLALAGPRVPADHVEICLSALLKFLILLECMFLKTIDIPREQLEHVGILLAVFGGLAEGLFGEVDLEGGLGLGLLRGKTVHLEMIYIFDCG